MSKVSVIIPIYNKEEYILRSIKSVLNQTFNDFILILINDGSTDDTGKIIKNNINDSRVLYYEHQNKGVSYTRNKGIELATTPYITFLDADDEFHPEFLEKMIDSIGSSDVVYCGYQIKKKESLKINKMNFYENNALKNFLNNKFSPNTDCWLIRKDFLDKYNIRFSEDISWGEDKEFFAKVLLHSKKVKFVKDYLTYYYTDVEKSLSENNLGKINKDIVWMRKLKKYILSSNIASLEKKRITKTIDTYRLPAIIIYRINSNLDNLSNKEVRNILKKHNSIIKSFRPYNGIRSLKLALFYVKILAHALKWR